MTNEEELTKKINKAKLIKNLHVCEATIGFIGATGVTLIGSYFNSDNYLIFGLFVLSGTIFYHGLSTSDKYRDYIDDLNNKIMLKDLEN